MKGDKLQQRRRHGSEVTQKEKLNTEMEWTVRIVNLSDCTRDTRLHCFYSFPWRVPHCSIFKNPVEGSLLSPLVIIQERLRKAGPKGRVAFQQSLKSMCLTWAICQASAEFWTCGLSEPANCSSHSLCCFHCKCPEIWVLGLVGKHKMFGLNRKYSTN